ncbi:helicase associated domain-containing protein [Nocardia sp. NPDC051990]|uniref:helicase associated domain-containing protein n=1 Tax=Nocardia sp. NPDC051990 TaxID=3155285 RepID=UPI0034169AE1
MGITWAPFTSEWAAWLAALGEFRAAHGHSDVPYGHMTADGRALGTWLSACSRRHRTGELSAERTAALEALGVDWDRGASRREHRWETGLAALREHHAQTGDANPTIYYVTADGFPLGQWLNDRREERKAGRLPDDQFMILEVLGVQWHPAISKRNSRWESALAALTTYRGHYGHTNVHATYMTPDGFGLGKWLHRRRGEHRAGTLPADRVRQLEAAGIDMAAEGWGRQLWMHHLEALDQFRREHGHANPVQRYRAPDGFLLGTWIGKCRKGYRDGMLSAEQIDELRARGVDLDPQPGGGPQRKQARWESGLRELTEFRRARPHATIASAHITADGFRLGAWLADCRRDYRDGRLSAEQAAALAALGVDLHARRAAWADRIAQLAEYRREHGTADLPRDYTVDGAPLGAWLSKQRTKLARDQLSPARAAQLRALGVGSATRG